MFKGKEVGNLRDVIGFPFCLSPALATRKPSLIVLKTLVLARSKAAGFWRIQKLRLLDIRKCYGIFEYTENATRFRLHRDKVSIAQLSLVHKVSHTLYTMKNISLLWSKLIRIKQIPYCSAHFHAGTMLIFFPSFSIASSSS